MSNLSVLAFDETPRGNGGRGATEQIARLLDNSEIDDKIKSIINYVSISNQDEENNKSAAIEEKNDEIDEENNISNLILTEKEKFEMLL